VRRRRSPSATARPAPANGPLLCATPNNGGHTHRLQPSQIANATTAPKARRGAPHAVAVPHQTGALQLHVCPIPHPNFTRKTASHHDPSTLSTTTDAAPSPHGHANRGQELLNLHPSTGTSILLLPLP
jgi:hypothetical protein